MKLSRKLFIMFVFISLFGCVLTPANVETPLENRPFETTSTSEKSVDSPQTASPTLVPSATNTPVPTPTISLPPVIDKTNVTNLVEVGKIYQSYPNKVFWTDENSYFAVQSQNQVVLYDAKTLVSVATFAVLENTILLGFSPKNKQVAVTTDQQTIEIWDLITNEKYYTIQAPGMFNAAYFTPDGWLAVDSLDEIAVNILDPTTGEILRSHRGFQTAAPVYSTMYSKDSRWLLWISRGTIQIGNIETEQLGPSFSHEDFINSQTLSPDGTLLVTSAGGTLDDTYQSLLYFWDTNKGSLIQNSSTDEMAYGLDFSYKGDLLSAGVGKSVIIWDSNDQTQMVVLDGFTDNVNFTAFSPDGRFLAATSFDNSIRFWQIGP